MSLFAPTALGLDASDGTLKAVLLRRRGRRVELLRAWRSCMLDLFGGLARSVNAFETAA